MMLTLSGAAPVVHEAGFPVEYVASYATPGAGSDWRWSRRLRGRLREVLSEARPSVLVFDGAHPYQALIDAMPASPGTRRVWCRRPMWKPGSNPGALARESFFHEVLEPGEFAESVDRGPTVARRDRAHVVAPVVFCEDSDLLERGDAERELGLEPGKLNVLVQLGQGTEVRAALERCVRHLVSREGVQVAALESALASLSESPGDVVHLRSTYPISRYYSAFDGVISAAGYNTYHELIRFGVPALYLPMHRQTDDQPARARYAEAAGLGLGLTGPDDPELEAQIERLLHPEERNRIQAGIVQLDPANGSADAAGWLEGLRPGEATDAGAGKRGSFRSWRRRWGTFLSSMPQTASRLTRQTLTQRPPRALVVAVGIPDDELPAALMAALAEADESPERTLVVTDSLALGRLRDLGFGIEHVPTRGSRQHVVADVPYEEFLHRRLELIRAERPRPPRLLSAPGGAPLP